MNAPPEVKLRMPPQYVGAWLIGGPLGIKLPMLRRPRWLTRVLSRWLLEWDWIEGKS